MIQGLISTPGGLGRRGDARFLSSFPHGFMGGEKPFQFTLSKLTCYSPCHQNNGKEGGGGRSKPRVARRRWPHHGQHRSKDGGGWLTAVDTAVRMAAGVLSVSCPVDG